MVHDETYVILSFDMVDAGPDNVAIFDDKYFLTYDDMIEHFINHVNYEDNLSLSNMSVNYNYFY